MSEKRCWMLEWRMTLAEKWHCFLCYIRDRHCYQVTVLFTKPSVTTVTVCAWYNICGFIFWTTQIPCMCKMGKKSVLQPPISFYMPWPRVCSCSSHMVPPRGQAIVHKNSCSSLCQSPLLPGFLSSHIHGLRVDSASPLNSDIGRNCRMCEVSFFPGLLKLLCDSRLAQHIFCSWPYQFLFYEKSLPSLPESETICLTVPPQAIQKMVQILYVFIKCWQ